MKKTVTIEKELDFPTMIGEISSISLDQEIKFIDKNNASGNLILSGTYKKTEASTLEEDFKYEIPAMISITEDIDIDSAKISISDFDYEIIGDDLLKCNISLLLDAMEVIDTEDEKEDLRECDGDLNKESINEISIKEAEIEDVKQENKKVEEIKEKDIDNSNISSLFQAFENSEETFTTYSVYIMRKEDSLDKIMDKYKISKEELSEYNDLNSIEIGSKIIIPSVDE